MSAISMILAAMAMGIPSNDYALEQNWLCRPDRRDACTVPRDTTAIASDGTMTTLPFKAAVKPEADCFYVYPTVSFDDGGNSDMVANEEERRVIEAQFARFAAQCRTFAPLYRQVTLTALRAAMAGQQKWAPDRDLGYSDVREAWRHYLKHDSRGRPFVLIGHSQGAGILKRLVAEEIEGRPEAQRMLSTMLLGHNLLVADGKDTGGDFKTTPLCRKAAQSGCVIAYASFRDTAPPPASSRYGKSSTAGMSVACTNPAALAGGKAVLAPVFAAGRSWEMARPTGPWSRSGEVRTPYVSLPGLVSAECKSQGGVNWLSIAIAADPADPRTDDLPGDVVVGNTVLADWGLHLIDVSLAYDTLIGLIPQQLAAWKSARR